MSDNPYAPPESEAAPADPEVDGGGRYHAEQDGDNLVIDKTATFPKVCLKCGSKEVTSFQDHLFQYNPPYVFILIFLCTLPGLIAMLVLRKTAKMVIPLCSECDARWRSGKVMAMVGIGVLLLGILGPYFLGSPEMLLLGFLVGIGAFLAIIFLKVNPAMLRARKIDDSRVTIIGIHPDATRVILKRSL
ncbi:MAG: hypothetical protein H6718_27475 [Polyangiaceae bacterium]|nr:hypothetical protein [Myxococcales bacterium]MCB9589185.1 hypothetical protein [Polyangiaceae bacterium]